MNVRKKLMLLGFSLFAINTFAQTVDFGLKVGMVYNADKGAFKALNGAIDEKGKGSVGFQGGAMVRIKAGGIYVQPELLYTAFKNEFEEAGETIDVKKSRLDIPVNIGKTFAMGLVQIQTGPVFSLNFEDTIDSDGINFPDATERDEIGLGWQIGTGVNLKGLNIDLRYEFGLNKNITKYNIAGAGEFQTENRSNLLNLSVGYFF
ncbi:outer membrane beta-barrel protein [Moheibacter sediminis]|nr:outer membrane beta-barrel protein [Moheibacter sediminis]